MEETAEGNCRESLLLNAISGSCGLSAKGAHLEGGISQVSSTGGAAELLYQPWEKAC